MNSNPVKKDLGKRHNLEGLPENLETDRIAQRYAVGITNHISNLIKDNPNGPVARQYIPRLEELKILPEETPDPIGDLAHTPLKGLVHRYPARVLFKIIDVCTVYCRYCFRREMIGPQNRSENNPLRGEILTDNDRQKALEYVRNHEEIQEVILSGGDPLVLSADKLRNYLDELESIEHVQVLRIHTRVPVAAPERIADTLCKALNRNKALYVVIHINHVDEITPEVEKALKNLHLAGCVLLSQSVLLKDINDDVRTLETLFQRLISLRVKPYYLHHPDLAPGTSHFRLPLSRGRKIFKSLLGRLSGIARPHYMLDIPGGHGKISVEESFIEEIAAGHYELTDHKGRKHIYTDQPE